ncbi:hypothetical protein C7212DRAFT_286368 [Tuber magnatum]|uniref:SAP domain-containing protein n=1 Tax=Tuber magnatum TaxID=42249 RepID=A0A317SEK0_9PEZI|nr:hypothetical protein C7212DRAFT_286368 [Tuber magnatum]
MPTLEELRKKCKAVGLSAKGNKTQLAKRLTEAGGPCPPSSVESEEDPMCDAVLATKGNIGCEGEMTIDAKVTLGLALDNEELEVQVVRGTVYVGNRRGLDFAEVREYFRIIDAEITSLKQSKAALEQRSTALQEQYKQVRERFLGTFRRDILKNATKRDYDIIKAGNVTAHGGDVAVDALLYEGVHGRHDSRTFIELYGMTPSDAQKIQHKETIQILNTHAGVRADTQKNGSEEYYRRFQVFIERFEQSDHDMNYLEAVPPTDLTRAYWDLLNCERYEDSTIV